MYDVVIIGAGPAGMTAAIYALRNNLKVALIEKNVPGGVVVNTSVVENYPGFVKIDGPDLAYSMFEQVTALGVDYFGLTVTGILVQNDDFVTVTDGDTFKSKTLIIASGTKQRKLGVPGEERFKAKGISWCAICDGALYKNKDVAVIGGGNSAFEETIYLSNLVNKVYLIHRREGFRAENSLVEKVRSLQNVEMILNSRVVEFVGDDSLEAITVNNKITGRSKSIKVKGCFEYIGTLPSTDYIKNLGI